MEACGAGRKEGKSRFREEAKEKWVRSKVKEREGGKTEARKEGRKEGRREEGEKEEKWRCKVVVEEGSPAEVASGRYSMLVPRAQ